MSLVPLTQQTAERIRRQLDRSPGDSQEIGTGRWRGNRPFFARCTSATPAYTSGVGAQCYPAVLVELDPAATSLTDLGTVWLSLIGSGGVFRKPLSGRVYEVLLRGDVEAATSDTRPRAYAVADCCDPAGDTPTTVPLNCTISGGSGAGSGVEGVCCELFLGCDGSVTSICSGNTLTPYEVAEFVAACGDSLNVTYETCWAPPDCTATTWYCHGTDDPCDRLFAAGNLCVNIKSGTRAYRAITSTGVNVTAVFTTQGWALDYAFTDSSGNTTFRINGTLRWCSAAGVPGLYFFGTIQSTADDPDNPATFPCGCYSKLDDCSILTADGSETITSGPTGTACELTGETLLITTACGTLQLVITTGSCTSPPPPPPPTTTCSCTTCATGAPGRWALPANGTLPAFDAVDYVSGCMWVGTSGTITATMFYNGSTWKLVYTGGGVTLADYTISGAFACCASNTFNLNTSDPGLTGLSSSITMTTAQSCTCPAPAATYDCVSGRCVDPGDGSGAYASLALCRAAPCDTLTTGKYYCMEPLIPGDPRVCLEGSAAGTTAVHSGPYDSLALCTAGCGDGTPGGESCCDKLVGKTATLTIPNGTYAGNYTGTWSAAGGGNCQARFGVTVPEDTALIYDAFNAVWLGIFSASNVAATLDTCADPVAIHSIPNSLFGGTGDAVVTTPL